MIYKKLLVLIVSLNLIITSLPCISAEEYLAVPGTDNAVSKKLSDSIQQKNTPSFNEYFESLRKVKPADCVSVDGKNYGGITDVYKIRLNGKKCFLKTGKPRVISSYIIPQLHMYHKVNPHNNLPCFPKIEAVLMSPSGRVSGIIFDTFASGKNLAQYVKKTARFDEKIGKVTYVNDIEALNIMINIAEIIEKYVHSNKVLHRDLNPHNIYITDTGEAILLDFDLSALITYDWIEDRRKIQYQMPALFIPGDLQQEGIMPDYSDDIYALGKLLYFMREGTLLFSLSYSQALQLPDPPLLLKIINRATYHNREYRYHSIKEFIKDLKNCRNSLKNNSVENTEPDYDKGKNSVKSRFKKYVTCIKISLSRFPQAVIRTSH